MVLFVELSALFDSITVVDKAIDDGYFTELIRREIMFKKNPYGKEFPSKSPELVSSLLKDLEIDTKHVLDSSLLRLVEDKIGNLPKPYHFYRNHLLKLLPYWVK